MPWPRDRWLSWTEGWPAQTLRYTCLVIPDSHLKLEFVWLTRMWTGSTSCFFLSFRGRRCLKHHSDWRITPQPVCWVTRWTCCWYQTASSFDRQINVRWPLFKEIERKKNAHGSPMKLDSLKFYQRWKLRTPPGGDAVSWRQSFRDLWVTGEMWVFPLGAHLNCVKWSKCTGAVLLSTRNIESRHCAAA